MSLECKKLLLKYKEQLLYLIFGGLTTLVNWIVYVLATLAFSLNVSNIIAWFLTVIFAFVVNKFFVFKSKALGLTGTFTELFMFFSARVFSGVFEIFGLPLLIYIGLDQTLFGVEGAAAKVIISVLVVILNYILSKKIIFK